MTDTPIYEATRLESEILSDVLSEDTCAMGCAVATTHLVTHGTPSRHYVCADCATKASRWRERWPNKIVSCRGCPDVRFRAQDLKVTVAL